MGIRYIVFIRPLHVRAMRVRRVRPPTYRNLELVPGDSLQVHDEDKGWHRFRTDIGWVHLPAGSYRPVTDIDFVIA